MSYDKKEVCPVCRMQVGNNLAGFEYHKTIYVFCSLQCRETFEARPLLYTSVQSRDHNEVIKSRRIRLIKPLEPELAEAITEYMQILMGFKECHTHNRWFTIRYDLLQLNLVQIERTLNEVGVYFDKSWWHKFWLACLCSMEETELDNLVAIPSACCNRPPRGV